MSCKEVVAKTTDFFLILLSLVREYDMNNVLHNEVVKIIDIALTEAEGTPLKEAVLRDNILLNFIVEECEEDKKIKAGDSVYSSRKGYIAHVINLCVRLRELGETSASIQNLV